MTEIAKKNTPLHSILRMLEYRELSRMPILGKVLDLGGSTHSGYQDLFKENAEIDTLNIDPAYGANIIASVEDPFRMQDSSYDHVLAINLIEHIYKVANVFSETARVLKKGGKFIIVVPFFHHVHGSPDDYHRYTASCLKRMCGDVGLEVLEIKELGGGLFSTWFQMLGGIIRPLFIKILVMKACHNTDVFLASISKGYDKMRKNNPLGYFVIAQK